VSLGSVPGGGRSLPWGPPRDRQERPIQGHAQGFRLTGNTATPFQRSIQSIGRVRLGRGAACSGGGCFYCPTNGEVCALT
jgi:hypothetical protein